MEAVLFDWDGTLLDSLPGVYQANVEVMRAFGLPFDEHHYRDRFTADWRVMYRRLGVPDERMEEASAIWTAAFDGGRHAELFPGVVDALERLRGAGRTMGIVTSGHRDIVAPQLARLGVQDFFQVVVYGDDHPVHKPDPGPLRAALTTLRLAGRAAETAYVGDTRDDMAMAVAVGAVGVGVTSLIGDADELRRAGASIVTTTVAEWVAADLDGLAGTDLRESAPRQVGRGLLDPPHEPTP
jgi:HAD superfamily hydrolase (TIGR01549 family)